MMPLAGLLIVWQSCGGGGGSIGSGGGVQIDAALASAIPSDTVNIAGGRVDLLQKSPLYARIKPMLPASGDNAVRMRERFGLDPGTDLREFVFAHNGKAGLLLARAKFQSKEIIDRLTKEGAERFDYKGKAILGRSGTSAGLAILGEGVLAGGATPQLHAAIDAITGGGGRQGLSERLAKSLATLPAGSHLYFAGSGGATLGLPQGTNIGNLDKVLASIDSIAGFVNLDKGIKLAATGQCTDEAGAKRLHTQLRGLIGMGRLSTPDNQPEILRLFDAIDTRVTGKTIQLGVDLTTEQAEKAFDLARGMSGGGSR